MRLVVLIPDLVHGGPTRLLNDFLARHALLARIAKRSDWVVHPSLRTNIAWGGTLNNMRHAAVARSLGIDAVLASPTGRNTYGAYSIVDLPFIRWSDRRPDDVVLVPDFVSELVDEVRGPVIAYMQVPTHLRADFDFRPDRVHVWTDSPFMLEKCRAIFPGKSIPIVPNIVDDERFPFIPQSDREQGLVFAFPRKGVDYIERTQAIYRRSGGKFWRFELIDGLPLDALARRMRRPQVFLASAQVEGCALPPQESMAAGIVVVGRSARGANFAMEHRRTAMVAETPEEAAAALIELEDADLRDRISRAGHAFIRRYFPEGEPMSFWRERLRAFGFPDVAVPPAVAI
jgi:glycosyltransferase involved in cell wall biosynthesis